jgi:hypothetical protein
MGISANQSPVRLQGSVTLPAAAGDSDAFSLGPNSLVAIETPATLVSTSLTLKACATKDGTFVPVHDSSGNAVTITVGTSRYITLQPAQFGLLPYIKLTTAATETATRTINLYTRPIL